MKPQQIKQAREALNWSRYKLAKEAENKIYQVNEIIKICMN